MAQLQAGERGRMARWPPPGIRLLCGAEQLSLAADTRADLETDQMAVLSQKRRQDLHRRRRQGSPHEVRDPHRCARVSSTPARAHRRRGDRDRHGEQNNRPRLEDVRHYQRGQSVQAARYLREGTHLRRKAQAARSLRRGFLPKTCSTNSATRCTASSTSWPQPALTVRSATSTRLDHKVPHVWGRPG